MASLSKLDGLYAMLDAACNLLKARAIELCQEDGDHTLCDDEEYCHYLQIQLNSYDKIKEIEKSLIKHNNEIYSGSSISSL